MSSSTRATAEAIERIRELVDQGEPWEACDAFRETSAATTGADPELLFWGALAHARSGATHEVHALLDRAEPLARESGSASLLTEILSLRGRLWKDRVHRTRDIAGARPFARRALEQYLAAYAIAQEPFPGVNAASLALLLGDVAAAREAAAAVIAMLTDRLRIKSAWDLASLGEAQLVSGDLDAARQSYGEAYRACNANAGMVASMRRQLLLLSRALPDAASILEAVPQASVVSFAGHLIDTPDRPTPRFPAALVARVDEALRGWIAALRRPIAYASAACGADLLFVEAVLDLGGEVSLVLPFDRDDFVRTSVAIGGEAWIPRFERAVARAHRVVMATEERYLGDDVLFDHAAREVEGFAILRAAQLETEPTMLCVVDLGDTTNESRIGGTGAAFARWIAGGRDAHVIDLAALPGRVAGAARSAPSETGTASKVRSGVSPMGSSRGLRSVHSMLFADIAGYSRLHDTELPRFQHAFLDLAASLIESSGVAPREAKTWGDGLYAVFDEAGQAAEFALRFAERMRDVREVTPGDRDRLAIRIALHTGAVFRMYDPVMRQDSHFGANVTRAARIEPITPPGLVYASEAFAATLASDGASAYALEYVGALPLAKGYGESRVYRLERR